MLFVGCRHILRHKGEVKFLLAEVIGLRAVAQPCQFKLKIRDSVAEVYEPEAAVGGCLFTNRLQSEGLVIEFKAPLKVENIKIEV